MHSWGLAAYRWQVEAEELSEEKEEPSGEVVNRGGAVRGQTLRKMASSVKVVVSFCRADKG